MKVALLAASALVLASNLQSAQGTRFGFSPSGHSFPADQPLATDSTTICGMECDASDHMCACMRLNTCVKSFMASTDDAGLDDALAAGGVGACARDPQTVSMLESVILNIPNLPGTLEQKKAACRSVKAAVVHFDEMERHPGARTLGVAVEKAKACSGKVYWKEVNEGRAEANDMCGRKCPLEDAECRCGRMRHCVWSATRRDRYAGREWFGGNTEWLSIEKEEAKKQEVFGTTVANDLARCFAAETAPQEFESMAHAIVTGMRYAKRPRKTTHVRYKKTHDLFAVRQYKRIITHETRREVDKPGLKDVCETLAVYLNEAAAQGLDVEREDVSPLLDALDACLPQSPESASEAEDTA